MLMNKESAAVETIPLGSSDIRVSPLGIGIWAWGDRFVWGYRRGNDAELQATFQAALDMSINFFDTAELYGLGRSEALLGQFMKATGQKPVIATKFMPLPWRFRKAGLISALRRSLKRLQMAQVDLYQIHWPIRPIGIETWMEALADAVQAGLTRTVGVSNYDLDTGKNKEPLRKIALSRNETFQHRLERPRL